jgi:hypothetical protein
MRPPTLLAAILLAQALPYPNPRDQNCAPGCRSSGVLRAPARVTAVPAGARYEARS